MSLSGSLQEVTVADVLQYVHMGASTGVLRLVSGEDTAELGFHRGEVVTANYSQAPRFGERILAKGWITREQLSEALEVQRSESARRPLGDVFVEKGWVSERQVQHAVTELFKDTILELVQWPGGRFEFERTNPRGSDRPFEGEDGRWLFGVKINTELLLLEVARYLDEKTAVKESHNSIWLSLDETLPSSGPPTAEQIAPGILSNPENWSTPRAPGSRFRHGL